MTLRQGKKQKRIIYLQAGERPSDDADKVVGFIDSVELSERICSQSVELDRLRYELQRAVDAYASKTAEFDRAVATIDRLKDVIRIGDAEIREIMASMLHGPCADVNAKHRFELERITENAVKVSNLS